MEPLLTDAHARPHSYLRISLTERCNLRCTYCMPAQGVQLSPPQHLMSAGEIMGIASVFVKHGVNKIRLTGGEPLLRKDFEHVVRQLATLPVGLTLTTNAVIADQFMPLFQEVGIKQLNVSLDSLQEARNNRMTRRAHFARTWENIHRLLAEGFVVKLNVVLMKGENDDEIADFVALTQFTPLHIRFIEFMPFDGNRWNRERLVSYKEIIQAVETRFSFEKIADAPNDTSRNYRLRGAAGTFGIISSVTNPFCDTCNRLRLTANGRLKNCLFSAHETDLLTAFRKGEDIEPLIRAAMLGKAKARGGMDTDDKLASLHGNNRSMILIGG